MLKIINLHKTYKSKEGVAHKALNGINLEFGSKGFIVLLGKSGSGKSTLLNILGGLDHFNQGEIIIKGKSTIDFKPSEWDSYRNTYVGFVFQEFYIIEEYTVGKNIALSLELQGYPKEQIDARVEEILNQVELDGYMHRRPNEVSGGQKQRIAIARALVKDPQIILADEPTGNLDSETGRLILETLKKLSKEKLVIMVTHDADFAREYGDRIIELKDGEVINDQINYNQSVVKEDIFEVENKSIMRLPKGKQLTQKMINYLNEKLLNNEQDLYLSITKNQKLVSDLIPHHETESVEQYDVKAHLESDYHDSFALKKSALPFSHAFKLALSSLLTRKFRLFLVSVLFVMALIFVGIASNFTFYDIARASALTFEKANVSRVPVFKYEEDCIKEVTYNYCMRWEVAVTKEDIAELKNQFKTINFQTSVKYQLPFTSLVSPETYIPYESWNPNYDSNTFTVVSFVDQNKSYKLRYGQDVVNDEDILITDYMASMLIKANAFQDITELKNLVGQKFNYSGYRMNISGIVETDYENYAHIKNDKIGQNDQDFNQKRNFEYQQLYIKEKTFLNQFNKVISTVMERKVGEDKQPFRVYKPLEQYRNHLLIGQFPNNEKEIVPTLTLLNQLGLINYEDYHNLTILESLLNTEISLEIIDAAQFKGNYTPSDYLEHFISKQYKIVGIIDEFDSMGSMIVNEVEFDALYRSSMDYKYNQIIYYLTVNLGKNTSENEKLFRYLDTNGYTHQTTYSGILYQVDNLTKSGKTIFYWIGGVISLFTAFMIYTFISSSIKAKQKDIGTLRAIGARGFDVAKIFLTEGLMIAFISGFFANILIAIIVRLINNSITSNFEIPLVLLYTSVLSVLIVFGLAAVVIVIGTFLPLKRITNMKPIKAIKNN